MPKRGVCKNTRNQKSPLHLFDMALKQHILLTLVQALLLLRPEMQDTILSLEQLAQDGCHNTQHIAHNTLEDVHTV